jgi:hypothetical protein
MFAAGYHGVFKSTDGGSTWTYLSAPARIEESRNINSPLQEPPTITFQGAWSMITPSNSASTYQFASTPEPQDTATFTFLGTGVEWIGLIGQAQGSASITLDGVAQGTVDLTGTGADQYQQTVWKQQGLTCGNHTLTVTASLQTTQSLSIDAFDIWLANCPYTTQ